MRLRPRRAEADLGEVRDFARVLVRAGYLDQPAMAADVGEAAARDAGFRDPAAAGSELVAAAVEELAVEQSGWPAVTDHDRLVDAFTELRSRGVLVLEHVEDHWTAAAALEAADSRGERPTGVVWFTPPDVWHAVCHGMLELNVWHGDSANVALGDSLLDEVVEVLARHGLSAHFDEGRVEVAARWQRR